MLRSTARVIVTQQKTGLPLHFEITVQTRNSIYAWLEEIGLDSTNDGMRTMRRTKASLIYKQTKNLRAIQLLLGHT